MLIFGQKTQRRAGSQVLRERDEEANTTKPRGAVREDMRKELQGQDRDQRAEKREHAALRRAGRRDTQEQDSGGGNIYTTHMTTPVDRKGFVMGVHSRARWRRRGCLLQQN